MRQVYWIQLILHPFKNHKFTQEKENYCLLMWMVHLQIVKGAQGREKDYFKPQQRIRAKVRKEDAKQKPLIINGNFSVEDTQ